MKKALLPALALAAFAAPAIGHAQDGVITADATIPYETSFFADEKAVEFGTLTPGTDKTVNFNDVARGHLGLQFNYKSVVTFENAAPLTQRDGRLVAVAEGRTITPTYFCRVIGDNGQQTSPTSTTALIEGGITRESYSCFIGNTMQLDLAKNGSGQSIRTNRWILIGGRILGTDTSLLPAGTYMGQVRVTVTQAAS